MESFEKFEGSLEELNGPAGGIIPPQRPVLRNFLAWESPEGVASVRVWRMLAPGRAFIIHDPDRDHICQFKSEKNEVIYAQHGISTLHGCCPESNNAPVFPENSQPVLKNASSSPRFSASSSITRGAAKESAQRLYQKAKCIEVEACFFSEERADRMPVPFSTTMRWCESWRKARIAQSSIMNPVTLPTLPAVGSMSCNWRGFWEVYGNTPTSL